MNRCIDCDGLLMKEEKVCQICGAVVPEPPGINPALFFTRALQVAFLCSFGAMVAGIFTDIGPGFVTSLLLSCALAVVMRSLKDRPESVTKRR